MNKGICKKTGMKISGYVAWNFDGSKYYIVNDAEHLTFQEIDKETLDHRIPYLHRGKSQETNKFVRGFLIKDSEGFKHYIGSFCEDGELVLTRVYRDSVGAYLGIDDIYQRKIFSNSKVILHTSSGRSIGRVISYLGKYYFERNSKLIKPLHIRSQLEIL